jgi:Prokaryotic membrane lipoprotein lipid attachment site
MKRILIPALSLFLLSACSGNKEKDKSVIKTEEQAPVKTSNSETSAEDMAIKEWLLGKEWKAESQGAPFSALKIFSKDSCGFVDGTYHYTLKNGRFEILGAEWPFTRVNDSTFTIYVQPTRKTYTYKYVRNL